MDDLFLSQLRETFTVKDGRLMRRFVGRYEFDTGVRTIEHTYPTGEQVRFGGRVYRSSRLAHLLMTGELPPRITNKPKIPRYRAQVRVGDKVKHLGYFDTEAERDEAVFKFRLGLK